MKPLTLAISLLLGLASSVSAQPSSEILLTAGVVKHVDLPTGTLVLDNGRKLRPHLVLVKDKFGPLSTVERNDVVFVAGADLGFEETHPSALPAAADHR